MLALTQSIGGTGWERMVSDEGPDSICHLTQTPPPDPDPAREITAEPIVHGTAKPLHSPAQLRIGYLPAPSGSPSVSPTRMISRRHGRVKQPVDILTRTVVRPFTRLNASLAKTLSGCT